MLHTVDRIHSWPMKFECRRNSLSLLMASGIRSGMRLSAEVPTNETAKAYGASSWVTVGRPYAIHSVQSTECNPQYAIHTVQPTPCVCVYQRDSILA